MDGKDPVDKLVPRRKIVFKYDGNTLDFPN